MYYAGYKEVLKNKETIERTMPSSFLRVPIVSLIAKFLNRNIADNCIVGTNEPGLHLGENNNLANDIQIIDKNDLKDFLSKKYLEIPPKVVVEVDIQASSENFENKTFTSSKNAANAGCWR